MLKSRLERANEDDRTTKFYPWPHIVLPAERQLIINSSKQCTAIKMIFLSKEIEVLLLVQYVLGCGLGWINLRTLNDVDTTLFLGTCPSMFQNFGYTFYFNF